MPFSNEMYREYGRAALDPQFRESLYRSASLPSAPPRTGFWDNFGPSFSAAMAVDFSTAEARNRSFAMDELMESIPEIARPRPMGRYGGYRYDRIFPKFRNLKAQDPVRYKNLPSSMEEFIEYSDTRAREFYDRAQTIGRYASGGGMAGQFVGAMSAMMLDPVNLAFAGGSMALAPFTAGGSMAVGAGRFGRILTKASATPLARIRNLAIAEVAAESAVLTATVPYKHQLGIEHTFSDTMLNLLLAGALGGTLGSVAEASRYLLRYFKTRNAIREQESKMLAAQRAEPVVAPAPEQRVQLTQEQKLEQSFEEPIDELQPDEETTRRLNFQAERAQNIVLQMAQAAGRDDVSVESIDLILEKIKESIRKGEPVEDIDMDTLPRSEATQKITQLLEGDLEVLEDFNRFAPPGYTLTDISQSLNMLDRELDALRQEGDQFQDTEQLVEQILDRIPDIVESNYTGEQGEVLMGIIAEYVPLAIGNGRQFSEFSIPISHHFNADVGLSSDPWHFSDLMFRDPDLHIRRLNFQRYAAKLRPARKMTREQEILIDSYLLVLYSLGFDHGTADFIDVTNHIVWRALDEMEGRVPVSNIDVADEARFQMEQAIESDMNSAVSDSDTEMQSVIDAQKQQEDSMRDAALYFEEGVAPGQIEQEALELPAGETPKQKKAKSDAESKAEKTYKSAVERTTKTNEKMTMTPQELGQAYIEELEAARALLQIRNANDKKIELLNEIQMLMAAADLDKFKTLTDLRESNDESLKTLFDPNLIQTIREDIASGNRPDSMLDCFE